MESLPSSFLGMPRALLFALMILLAVIVLRRIFGVGEHGADRDRRRRRLCPHCALSHPGFARYCRRCGKPLP